MLRPVVFGLASLVLAPAAARAEPVLVLGDGGRVRVSEEPLPPQTGSGPHIQHGPCGMCGPDPVAVAARRRTVPGELRRMLLAGAIDQAEHDERRAAYESARKLVRRLPGRRRVEMGAVVRLLERMAAQGSLTVSRLEPLWLTLHRNRRWWTRGPLLAPGRRVRFERSELVWQYFPGAGLHLHPLANFGKLNGLWQGRIYDDRLEVLLDELLPLAAERGGGLAWEYYFPFGGGRPPWVSGLAQGTALQALARAAIRLGRKEEVMPIAQEGLALFELPPPTGVRVKVEDGAHYLIYSYNSKLRVLNGFVQALVGLHDFAAYANDDRARALFAAGDRQARREVPRYDTGFWSLYSRFAVTRESNLDYHRLTRGFLEGLCERTAERVYCETSARFGDYLVEKPQIDIVTQRLRGGTLSPLRFRLSKISRVSVRVARGGRLLMQRGALMSHGGRAFAWAVPRKAGDYAVRVTATDLAGNTGTVKGTIEVLKPKRRRR